MTYPTADQIFDKPWPTPTVALPLAWEGDSIAVQLADQECARLISNALFEPPITEEEIEKYTRRFRMPKRQAEEELRKGRRDGNSE